MNKNMLLGKELIYKIYDGLPKNPKSNSPIFKRDLYGYLDKDNNIGVNFLSENELKSGKYKYIEYLGYIIWNLNINNNSNKVKLIKEFYKVEKGKLVKKEFDEVNKLIGKELDNVVKVFYSLLSQQLKIQPFKLSKIDGNDYKIYLYVNLKGKRTYLEGEFRKNGVKHVNGYFYDKVLSYCFRQLGIESLVEFSCENSMVNMYLNKKDIHKVCEGLKKTIELLNDDKSLKEIINNVGV